MNWYTHVSRVAASFRALKRGFDRVLHTFTRRATMWTTLAIALTATVSIALMGSGVTVLLQDYPFRYKVAAVLMLVFVPQVFWNLVDFAAVKRVFTFSRFR